MASLPISAQLSDPICRARPLRWHHSERAQPTAGNAKRQMEKHNGSLRVVFVQGRDLILRCLVRWQVPTGKEGAPAYSFLCLNQFRAILSKYQVIHICCFWWVYKMKWNTACIMLHLSIETQMFKMFDLLDAVKPTQRKVKCISE